MWRSIQQNIKKPFKFEWIGAKKILNLWVRWMNKVQDKFAIQVVMGHTLALNSQLTCMKKKTLWVA